MLLSVARGQKHHQGTLFLGADMLLGYVTGPAHLPLGKSSQSHLPFYRLPQQAGAVKYCARTTPR